MPSGPGVSIGRAKSGRWRVRWREWIREADGTEHAIHRERMVDTEATAALLRAKVLRAIELGETPDIDGVKQLPPVASLDQVFAGWERSRKARGVTQASLETYGRRAAKILAILRERHEIPADKGVPASLLTRDEVVEITLALKARGNAEASVTAAISMLLSAWTWGADDPKTYPGLSPAPRDTASVVPPAPVYTPTTAPSMVECDAVIRSLAARGEKLRVALPVAVIGRCTGLRTSQIQAMRVGDVHLAERSLTIASGKSRREKAERRIVPIAPALVDYLAGMVAGRAPEELVIKRRGDAKKPTHTGPAETIRASWEEVTEQGLARREVWAPPNRKYSRPDHAFRAAFQHHLVTMGVRDEVIDALVGHAPTLRGRHYVDASARWDAMVQAVATIPPIAWEADETAAAGGEVIPFPS